MSERKLDELVKKPGREKPEAFYHDGHYALNPVGFAPAALGIAIGRMFETNPIWLNWFGRIGGLIFYLITIFYAVKIIPVMKNALALFALSPMPLYQGSSVTYDVVQISTTFLLFALAIKYAFAEDKSVGWREVVVFAVVAIVNRYAKDGYPLLPFLFLLIPRSKFKFNFNPIFLYAGVFVFAYILYFLPQWTWHKLIAAQGYKIKSGSHRLQKDLLGSFPLNLKYQLKHPWQMIANLWKNIDHFRREWVGGIFGRFGYSYTLLPDWFFFIHGIVLATVAFLDGKEKIKATKTQKTIAFLIGFGSIFGIIVMNYFYSPVGNKMIFGLQGRYFIPAVPALLFVLYSDKFVLPFWKKYGSALVGLYAAVSLAYAIAYLDGVFYQL